MKINIAKINFNGGGGGSSTTIEALSVVENGVYEAPKGTAYTPVTVDVPIPTFSTEEKTVSITGNGQTVVDKSADKDGMTKVTVDVNVPAPEPVLETLTVTGNGSFVPAEGVDGYNKVDVNVAGGVSATALDYGNIGYTQTDPAFLQLQSDLTYSKQKYDEWEARPDKENASNLYFNDEKLVYAPLIDTSKTTLCGNMFGGCDSLTSVPLLDLSSCHTMDSMFSGCDFLITVPLFDTSKVERCIEAFSCCDSLITVPLFDLSSCTTCQGMFSYSKSLISVPSFDLSSCTNMNHMFNECKSLTTVPSNLTTSKVEDMNSMFSGCNSLTEIGEIDCSSVIVGKMYKFEWNNNNVTTLGGFKNLKVSLEITGGSWNPIDKIDRQSLMNVINDLGQADGTSVDENGNLLYEANPKLTICSKVYALLTPEDIKIATDKGWSIIDVGF